MKIILLIGTGSFIGGIFRYLTSVTIQDKISGTFPFGIFWVNIIGCFIVGILFSLSEKGNLDYTWRLFLVTGFCGGFTTFSSFSIDTLSLLRDGQYLPGFLYLAGTVFSGLIATFAGIALPKLI